MSDDAARGRFIRPQVEEFYWVVERVGTPDEVVGVKIHVAKGHKVADVHRKKIGPGRPG
jgi:hypothetical protein